MKFAKDLLHFGDPLEFNEIFSRVAYIAERNLATTKLYEGDTFTIVEPKQTLDKTIFPGAYRKVIFLRTPVSGIIIGQTKRSEGIYHAAYSDHLEHNYEPAYLEPKWTYTFWVVAVGMNKTVLIPK